MKSAVTWLHLPGKRSPFSPLNKGNQKTIPKRSPAALPGGFLVWHCLCEVLHPSTFKVGNFFNIRSTSQANKMVASVFSLNSRPPTTPKQSTVDFPKTWYFFGQLSKNFPFHHHFRSENWPFKTVESKFGYGHHKVGPY